MRGVLVTVVVAGGVLLAASGLGEAAGFGLEIGKAKVRLHRLRGLGRDRMKVRGTFPMLEGDFDPRYNRVDFLVLGREVLCGPGETQPEGRDPEGPLYDPSGGTSTDPDPVEPPDPGDPYYYSGGPVDYGSPVRDPGNAPRVWTRQDRGDGAWIYRTEGRRIEVDLVRGTFSASGRDLVLDVLPDAGPGGVDLTLVMGTQEVGTVIGFEQRGRTWTYSSR